MDRRGVIDKGIEAMPIFIAVFGLMLLYTLITAGIFGTHKLSERDAEFSTTNLPVVFEKIELQEESGNRETTFIQELRENGLNEKIRMGLKGIAPEKGCLYLHYKIVLGAKKDKQDLVFFQNREEVKSTIVDDFNPNGFWSRVYKYPAKNYTFSFTNPEEKYFVESYLGECLNE